MLQSALPGADGQEGVAPVGDLPENTGGCRNDEPQVGDQFLPVDISQLGDSENMGDALNLERQGFLFADKDRRVVEDVEIGGGERRARRFRDGPRDPGPPAGP